MVGEKTLPATGILLVLLFVVLYLVFLGVRALYIPDEVRYGEIAREMIVNGDWVVPRLNGLLYFEKPPFGHWLNAISLILFGENAFAIRFASALSAGVSAATVFFLGRRLFNNRQLPYLAVFVYLTTFEVQAIGTFGVLDSIFATTLNLGIATFAIAAMPAGRHRIRLLALAGVFFGIAFLTKGFLAFALPVLVLAPWLILNRDFKLLFRQGFIVVFAAIVVVLPWAIAIHLRQPDFWHYFFWVEHVQRFAAENAQHKAPFYYYLMYLPFVAFPWVLLLPAAARALRGEEIAQAHPRALLLMVLWAVAPFAFLSVASGKLITYILPCFVPFSLIVAAGLCQAKLSTKWMRAGLVIAGLVIALFLVALSYISFLDNDLPKYGEEESAKLAALFIALLLAVIILGYGAITKSGSHRLLSPGLAMSVILLTVPWVMPAESLKSKAPVPFLQDVYKRVAPDSTVVTNGSLVRAVSWALKRDDVYVVDGGGETTYGLEADDGRGRFLSSEEFAALFESRAAVLLICKGLCAADTMAGIPQGTDSWSYGNFNAYYFAHDSANRFTQ